MRAQESLSKFTFISPLLLLLLGLPSARAQEELWVTQFGTSDWDYVHAVESDLAGGFFVGGHTRGSLGGPNAGDWDIFVARFDGSGHPLWLTQLGSVRYEVVNDLAPDGSGGVYVGGWSKHSLGGPTAGEADVFVARYDGSGNQLWIRQFGTPDPDYCTGVAADGLGGVFVAGYTEGSLAQASAGQDDIILTHYDSTGVQTWAKQFGTAYDEQASAMAPDGSGGFYIGGMSDGDLGGRTNPNLGFADPYVARFDSAGNKVWLRYFGAQAQANVVALAWDSAGGVYVGGYGKGALGAPSAGDYDGFVAHYSEGGSQSWIRQYGTSDKDYVNGLAADGVNGVYVAGSTLGNLAGPSAGSIDAFVAYHDRQGRRIWIDQFGQSLHEKAIGIATLSSGSAVVGGWTQGTLGGPNAGLRDAFVAGYSGANCPADCDYTTGHGMLDIFDFLCFQNSFVSGETYACDCDTTTGVGVCDVFDFLCFQNAFVSGCP